jgi:hypothetical protein
MKFPQNAYSIPAVPVFVGRIGAKKRRSVRLQSFATTRGEM